jgi:acetyl-CoA carboxylase beta subunit
VDEVEELTFVIAPHKCMARYASTLNVTPEGGQEFRDIARFRLESVIDSGGFGSGKEHREGQDDLQTSDAHQPGEIQDYRET